MDSPATESPGKTIATTAAATVFAALVIWSGASVTSFVRGIYDLRDTVVGRGRILAQVERLFDEHNRLSRDVDALRGEQGHISQRLVELEQFRAAGGRYTERDGDRDRTRVEALEARVTAHFVECAREKGALTSRVEALEKKVK